MGVNRQKRHRKILNFYTGCFGFHKPYKVLCDGTFITNLVDNNLTPLQNSLSHLLHSDVHLFTTRCVLLEMKRLRDKLRGKMFEPKIVAALEAASQLKIARCGHEKCENAVKCIMEVVGENNGQRFFVSSTDNELREQLRKLPGVPIIYYVQNSGLFLEPVSTHQREYVKKLQEDRSHVNELELEMLKNRFETKTTLDEEKDLENRAIDVKRVKINRSTRKQMTMAIKDRPQFKRKKAKGPNPLSCKKKKNSNENHKVASLKVTTEGDQKRSRKRKRNRKHKGPQHANVTD